MKFRVATVMPVIVPMVAPVLVAVAMIAAVMLADWLRFRQPGPPLIALAGGGLMTLAIPPRSTSRASGAACWPLPAA